MNAKSTLVSIAIFLLFGPALALAGLSPNSEDATADRVRYRRLLQEIKSVDAEYSRAMRQAISEAKKDGKATLETKSRLLALTDKRDRILNRTTLLSLRHGWDLPESDSPNETTTEIPDERDRIFEPAEQMIKQRFAQDASRIAKIVSLPIVSIESVRQDKSAKKNKEKKWFIF